MVHAYKFEYNVISILSRIPNFCGEFLSFDRVSSTRRYKWKVGNILFLFTLYYITGWIFSRHIGGMELQIIQFPHKWTCVPLNLGIIQQEFKFVIFMTYIVPVYLQRQIKENPTYIFLQTILKQLYRSPKSLTKNSQIPYLLIMPVASTVQPICFRPDWGMLQRS